MYCGVRWQSWSNLAATLAKFALYCSDRITTQNRLSFRKIHPMPSPCRQDIRGLDFDLLEMGHRTMQTACDIDITWQIAMLASPRLRQIPIFYFLFIHCNRSGRDYRCVFFHSYMTCIFQCLYIDGLMKERRNSIANALELHLPCTNPSISKNGKKLVALFSFVYPLVMFNPKQPMVMFFFTVTWYAFFSAYIDGLVQDRCNPGVLTRKLRLSCTDPSISKNGKKLVAMFSFVYPLVKFNTSQRRVVGDFSPYLMRVYLFRYLLHELTGNLGYGSIINSLVSGTWYPSD